MCYYCCIRLNFFLDSDNTQSELVGNSLMTDFYYLTLVDLVCFSSKFRLRFGANAYQIEPDF